MGIFKKSRNVINTLNNIKFCNYEARKTDLQLKNQETAREIANRKKSEDEYALPGDIDLTSEQIAEIDEFWRKYEFLGKIDYRAFKTYYNRSGVFDPRYLPQYIYSYFLRPNTVPDRYAIPFQIKAYLPRLLSNAKQPEMIIRKIEGIYYNSEFEHITKSEAVRICLDVLQSGTEIVVKLSGQGGGKGVVFLANATEKELRNLFKTKSKLSVQKAIKQHPQMAKLNPSTVNTVRLTTVLHKGKFSAAAALIKIGSPNARVDNYKYGGCLLGVNLDGTVLPWALNIDRERITELPSGIKLGEGGFTKVPCFNSVLEMAEKAHYCIPKIKVVSWDIAVDDENEAEIIEANFFGDLRMHQVLTGPVFGDMTEMLLDSYVLPNYYKHGVTRDFDYKEFVNHIEITKYVGSKRSVTVPGEINGKPITIIGAYAFAYNQSIKAVTLPDTVIRLQKGAFAGCTSLEFLKLNLDGLKSAGREVVNWCSKLDSDTKKTIRAKS